MPQLLLVDRAAEQMAEMDCGSCGITFWVPETWRAEKQQTGEAWHCPNGHPRVYKESDVARIQKKLDEAMRTNTQLAERARLAEVAQEKAEKDRKRLLKRARAGLCLCCNRTFSNLTKHMATKHPDADK